MFEDGSRIGWLVDAVSEQARLVAAAAPTWTELTVQQQLMMAALWRAAHRDNMAPKTRNRTALTISFPRHER